MEYIKGKRSSYIPPFRMFLIISVLYFLFLSVTEEKDDFIKIQETKTEDLKDTIVGAIHKKEDVNISFDGIGDSKMALAMQHIKDSTEQAYISKRGLKAYVDSVFADENFLYRFISRKFYAMYLTDGKNFGELMFSTVQKLVFIMAPIMAFILLIIYYRKKIFYLQHLIFAFHFHAFVFFMLLLDDSLLHLLGNWTSTIVTISILIYLYIAIKKVYEQSWMKSFLKFTLLFIGYILLGVPVLAILTAVSAILLY